MILSSEQRQLRSRWDKQGARDELADLWQTQDSRPGLFAHSREAICSDAELPFCGNSVN